jgi:endonuclease VIII
MPEGDNILRVATVLTREIVGQPLARLELNDLGVVPELEGQQIVSVQPHGKQMLVNFEGGWSLRVHLGMHGSWLRKHVREARPARWTAVLAVGEIAYVCVNSYRAELLKTSALRTHPRLARLGPDLLAEPPDIDEMVRRACVPAHGGREIADLLLDQRIAAGIGNIYKSETLFEQRVHPRTRVDDLAPEKLRALYETAAKLMRLSLLTRRRSAVPLKRRPQPSSQRFFVYGRAGEPCLDCKTPIVRFLQGDMARSTYYCPTCQPARCHSPAE